MAGKVGVLIVLGAVLLTSEARSIGEAANARTSNQRNYQDYIEQQEYAEQQGEVDREARDIQENGMDSYQPQKESIRDVRDSAAEDVNTKIAEAGYRSGVNGDDEDLEQLPPNNEEVGVGRRGMSESEMKKGEEAVDSEVAEQQDEGLRQNSNVEISDGENYRPPRDNGPVQDLQEVTRSRTAEGEAAEAGYEGVRENEATYTGGEQEHNYNYNYAQEPEGAADGAEPQQQGIVANEENLKNQN